MASELLSGLWFFWFLTGRGREAAMWAERYLASPRDSVAAVDRYVGDDAVSEILRFTGDHETAARIKHEIVATARANPAALVRGVPILRPTAGTLTDLAWMELDAGRHENARSLADEALAIRREYGVPIGIAHALSAIAAIDFHEGDYERALKHFAEVTSAYDSSDDTDVIESRLMMAQCELFLGRHEDALGSLRGTLPTVLQLADIMTEALAFRLVAMFAEATGDAVSFATLDGATQRILDDTELRVFDDHDEAHHASCAARARRALGETAYGDAYAHGYALTLDRTALLVLHVVGLER